MSLKCILTTIIGVVIITVIYFPSRHARHYSYVNLDNVHSELAFKNDFNQNVLNLENCTYQDLILNNHDIKFEYIYEGYESLKLGGEYIPSCNPLLQSAIVIPYRNRSHQLTVFLHYIHRFLQKQRLWYRIFVVEQNDTLPFNRAKMLNYGAKVAMDFNFNCLILHDVDLIPINSGNIYGCSKKPRHMSSSLDTFRYNLPYLTLFGGAVSIQADQFKEVNGMSNLYYGWGAEDDDFYRRLEAHDLMPYRFPPEISKYVMLVHKKVQPSNERYLKLANSVERHPTDGLNSLTSQYEVHAKDLYTHVIVS